MGWFNYYGLIAMALLMLPNIIYAWGDAAAYEKRTRIKWLEIIEQTGRYGCFTFMIFNVPYTYFGFWFDRALLVYIVVNCALLALYSLGWVLKRDDGRFISLWLSAVPAVIFLFSGIVVASIPLTVCAVLFAVGHITISLLNCK